MSSLPLFVLHWGEVDRTLNVFNVEPQGRAKTPVKGSDLGNEIIAGSSVKRVGGGGSTRRVGGSGRVNRIGGSGGRRCL